MSSVRIGIDLLGRRYFLDCDVEEAGEIHALARAVEHRAAAVETSGMALTDADILLRVSLQLMAEVEAQRREPDFSERLEALSQRLEGLSARLGPQSGDD